VFLLDTNVISETKRSRQDPDVQRWIFNTPQEQQFLSAISLAEMMRGATRHRDPIQRKSLEYWIEHELREWLDAGVLPVSKEIAVRAGRIVGERDTEGPPISFADSLIAATAIDYGFILVTRNIKDFTCLPLQILNPWTDTEPSEA
jgi:predicted nucleic acid-binding protein